VDSSVEMLRAARERCPTASFQLADLSSWQPGRRFGVILANAVLQWVPGHGALLPALLGCLEPGGSLAVQMPDNLGEPAHQRMREVASSGPWAARLAGVVRPEGSRLDPAGYYRLLSGAGAAVDLWRTTYYHLLPGGIPDLIRWFLGTGLRPYLALLAEEERAAFLASYRSALEGAYLELPGGALLLPFPRLFLVATLR
jgi:trans-aconitate 2-methyltransferase